MSAGGEMREQSRESNQVDVQQSIPDDQQVEKCVYPGPLLLESAPDCLGGLILREVEAIRVGVCIVLCRRESLSAEKPLSDPRQQCGRAMKACSSPFSTH